MVVQQAKNVALFVRNEDAGRPLKTLSLMDV